MKFNKKKTKVLVLSHFLIDPILNDSAASTNIRNFLLPKVKKIVQVEHPFPNSKANFSYAIVYENGRRKNFFRFKAIKKPYWFAYVLTPLANIYFFLKAFGRYDLCVACENLSFISIFLFKKLGLIKKLVYYSVDYTERRFENPILNGVYHFLDRLACRLSDVNWVVAKAQILGRKENGVDVRRCSPFRVVPNGYKMSEIHILPPGKVDYYNLVFCGSLKESAGVQLAISSLPLILRRFPKTKLTLVGGGDFEPELKKMSKKLKVLRRVRFLGRIELHKDLIKILTRGSIGLAPYASIAGSISYRTDSGKIKFYLACGLPVITTKVPSSWQMVEKNKVGVAIDYDEKQLAHAVEFLLANKKRYVKYKANTAYLSREYDIDKILEPVLKNV